MWNLTFLCAFCEGAIVCAAAATPPSPADRCLRQQSLICTSAGWKDLTPGRCHHTHTCSSRSSARTAEPPGMDVKGGPSAFLSLTSKLAVPVPAGVGTILMVDVSLVFICHAACLCRLARKAAQRKAAQSYWLSDLSVCFGCGSL